MGTTAVRLLSARSASSSWRCTCSTSSRATTSPKASSTTTLITHVRSLNRCSSASVLRISITRQASQRTEEHTSELQSPCNLVCRLLLEKKQFLPYNHKHNELDL